MNNYLHIHNCLHTLENTFFDLLQISWQASVLALLIFTVRFLLGKRLPARWAYALWFLVVIRLLIPVLPTSPVSIHQVTSLPLNTFAVMETPKISEPVPETPIVIKTGQIASHPSLGCIFAMLWFAGALGLGAYYLAVNFRFLRRLRNATSCNDPQVLELASACAVEFGLRHSPPILETSLIKTPALFGIFRPKLLLPNHRSFSVEETRLVLLHEFAHLKRGDTYTAGLLAILQILHWFNPILWLAFTRLRAEREAATDALVLSDSRIRLKTLYGETLIKLMEPSCAGSFAPEVVGIGEDPKRLKERLHGIAHATSGAYGWSFPGILLIIIFAVSALTKGVAQQPAEKHISPPTEDSKEIFGTWRNLSANPRWYTKFTISETSGKIFMDLFSGKEAKQVAHIELPLTHAQAADYGDKKISISHNYGFMEETYTLNLQDKILILTGMAHYLKNDGRRNHTVTASFVRENSGQIRNGASPVEEDVKYQEGRPEGIKESEDAGNQGDKTFKFLGAGLSLVAPKDWVPSEASGNTILPPDSDGKSISIYQGPRGSLMGWLKRDNEVRKRTGRGLQTIVEDAPVTTTSGLSGHRATIIGEFSKEPNREFYMFGPNGGLLVNIVFNGDAEFKKQCDDMIMKSLKILDTKSP